MSQALQESYAYENGRMRAEEKSDMIDNYNSSFLARIERHQKFITSAENEIKAAELINNWHHVKELQDVVVWHENKIEILKTKLVII